MESTDREGALVEELFHQAMGATPESRRVFVAKSPFPESVKSAVANLLAATDSEEVLAHHVVNVQGCLAAIVGDRGVPEEHPEWVGKYQILEFLGNGGMGSVYSARNPDSRALVAVKLLRFGDERRFEREALALGRLRHENIAQLFDFAHDDRGRAFLVMELVEGVTIDKYCRDLGLRDRLSLLATLCRGVHHAHQRSVLHRDLKPSNVLITKDGRIKILDFGIAQLLDARRHDGDGKSLENPHPQEPGFGTRVTREGTAPGTPPYMSPEQYRAGTEVDTRSDIYSLGVLAHEILGGHRLLPTLHSSVSSSSLNASDPTLCLQPSPLRKRNPECGKDLEFVVQRCLAINPDERPASAMELAEEFQRVHDRRPVLGFGGLPYRATRLLQRRWRWFVSAAVSLTIAGVLLFQREVQQRKMLESGRRSKAAVQFIEFVISGGTHPYFKPTDPIERVLDRASASIESTYGDDPSVAAELLRLVIELYRGIREFDRAVECSRREVELQHRIDPEGPGWVDARVRLAILYFAMFELDEAEGILDDLAARFDLRRTMPGAEILRARVKERLYAFDESRRILDGAMQELDPKDPEDVVEFAEGWTLSASLMHREGRLAEGIELASRVIGWLDDARVRDPSLAYPGLRLEALRQRSQIRSHTGDFHGSVVEVQNVMGEVRELWGEDSIYLSAARASEGLVLLAAGRLAEARAVALDASTKLERRLGADHVSCIGLKMLLAAICFRANEPDRAIEILEPLLASARRVHANKPILLANIRTMLASAAALTGDADRLRAMYRGPDGAQDAMGLARIGDYELEAALGTLAYLEGDFADARRHLSNAQGAKCLVVEPYVAGCLLDLDTYLGALHWFDGDLIEAEKLLRRAHETQRARSVSATLDAIHAAVFFAGTLTDLGRFEEAGVVLDEIVARQPDRITGTSARLVITTARLRWLDAMKRFDESKVLAEELRDQEETHTLEIPFEKLMIQEALFVHYDRTLQGERRLELVPRLLATQIALRGESHPTVAKTRLSEFATRMALNLPHAGEPWLREFLERQPSLDREDLRVAYLCLSKFARDAGRYDEALSILDAHLLALYPDPDPEKWRGFLLARRAQYLALLGRLDEARAQFKECDLRLEQGTDLLSDVQGPRLDAEQAIQSAGK